MIVADASVLIAFLDTRDTHHARASAVVRKAIQDDEDIYASTVTLAEVLVGAAPDGIEQLRADLDALGVVECTIRKPYAATTLALLRAQTRLKMPDCFVLLAAMTLRAEHSAAPLVATLDAKLATAAEESGFSVL